MGHEKKLYPLMCSECGDITLHPCSEKTEPKSSEVYCPKCYGKFLADKTIDGLKKSLDKFRPKITHEIRIDHDKPWADDCPFQSVVPANRCLHPKAKTDLCCIPPTADFDPHYDAPPWDATLCPFREGDVLVGMEKRK